MFEVVIYSANVPTLDPTNDLTYQVIEKLLSDVTSRFPGTNTTTLFFTLDRFFHLGSDEVNYGCWDGYSSWMKSHSISNAQGLHG